MKLSGLEELQRALHKRADLSDVKKFVQINGAEMQRNMMRDAPVDTGFLKRSIKYSSEDNGFGARVTPEADYAIYLIYGTRFNYIQDFFRPNYYKQLAKFKSDLSRLMK